MNTLELNSTYAQKMLRIAEVLKTIAHPVRLDIIKLLGDYKNLTVSQIQDKLDCGCEQSMLSHHLNKMKDKRVLTAYKKGKFKHYSLKDKDILTLFTCIENSNFIKH